LRAPSNGKKDVDNIKPSDPVASAKNEILEESLRLVMKLKDQQDLMVDYALDTL
jgi:hypothetical protein